MIHLIKELYDNDFYNKVLGVRQDCILPPHLFSIYSEKIMRNDLEGFEGSIKIGERAVRNLRYAGDIIIAGSMKDLETLVTNVKFISEQAGLKLNTQNKKVMKVIGDQESIDMRDIIINGENIEKVDDIIYLDATFISDCDDSKEIRRRVAIARNAVFCFNNV